MVQNVLSTGKTELVKLWISIPMGSLMGHQWVLDEKNITKV